MSEVDPDIAMLARLAALDLSAVEHVHGRLVAADKAGEVTDLGRTYERVSRCLRQTLALKAKLTREAAAGRAPAMSRPPADPGLAARLDRMGDLQDAVARVAGACGHQDADALDDLFARLDIEIDDWTERPDFATADLDTQVRAACRLLGLPEALAEAWRDLPHPDDEPPWAEAEDEAEAEFDAEIGAVAATTAKPAANRWAGTWTEPPRENSG